MPATLTLSLIITLLGQAPAEKAEKDKASTKRLEYMTTTLAGYTLQSSDDRTKQFRFKADPVLRFTNPVGGLKDGAVFLWVDEFDRPTVATQFFWSAEGDWRQELSSLSLDRLTLKSGDGEWSPSSGGVQFKPVPGAEKPAATADQRLRQMRSLAAEFTAEHWFRRKTWNQLRLLSKPFARYGKPGSNVVDGTLFCFAHGTDPEVLLMVEARPAKSGPEWQFALAPMTTFAVNASHQGKRVWSLPPRAGGEAQEPNATFHVRQVPGVMEASSAKATP